MHQEGSIRNIPIPQLSLDTYVLFVKLNVISNKKIQQGVHFFQDCHNFVLHGSGRSQITFRVVYQIVFLAGLTGQLCMCSAGN